MPVFEVQIGNDIYELDAADEGALKKAIPKLRAQVAVDSSVDAATEGAIKRTVRPGTDEGQAASGKIYAYPRLEVVRPEHFNPSTTEGKINLGLGAGSAAAALGPTGLINFAKGAVKGLIGSTVGATTGKGIGAGLERTGLAPSGTSSVLGTAGGLVGGFSPKTLLSLAKMIPSGGGSILKTILGRIAAEGEKKAVGAAIPAAEAAMPAVSGAAARASSSFNPALIPAVSSAPAMSVPAAASAAIPEAAPALAAVPSELEGLLSASLAPKATDTTSIAMRLQGLMKGGPQTRATIKELINTSPPELKSQLEKLILGSITRPPGAPLG
jgi:hypothetical protein